MSICLVTRNFLYKYFTMKTLRDYIKLVESIYEESEEDTSAETTEVLEDSDDTTNAAEKVAKLSKEIKKKY